MDISHETIKGPMRREGEVIRKKMEMTVVGMMGGGRDGRKDLRRSSAKTQSAGNACYFVH